MTTLASAFRRSPAPKRGFVHELGDPQGRLYLLPSGIVWGEAAAAAIISGNAWSLAGTDAAFTMAGIIWREDGIAWLAMLPYAEMISWAESEGDDIARHMGRLVRRIGAKRPPWGGMVMDRPRIMGIVNATPDSFSDGGRNLAAEDAVANALAMIEAGADIIDVGGESTRPGSAPVSHDQEIARVVPVIRELAERGIAVSIDTRHAAVMQAALAAGARVINDVQALEGMGAMAVAAASDAALCLMHMQGAPQNMQADPHYQCAPLDVYDYLSGRLKACLAAGIGQERICIDPGIGFGKTVHHNCQILASLPLYHGLGCPVLLGASRKSFIAALSKGETPDTRLPGTIAANQFGIQAGVQVLRVHDAAQAVQAASVASALSA